MILLRWIVMMTRDDNLKSILVMMTGDVIEMDSDDNDVALHSDDNGRHTSI